MVDTTKSFCVLLKWLDRLLAVHHCATFAPRPASLAVIHYSMFVFSTVPAPRRSLTFKNKEPMMSAHLLLCRYVSKRVRIGSLLIGTGYGHLSRSAPNIHTHTEQHMLPVVFLTTKHSPRNCINTGWVVSRWLCLKFIMYHVPAIWYFETQSILEHIFSSINVFSSYEFYNISIFVRVQPICYSIVYHYERTLDSNCN